jgi:DNA-binding beta-propeller fold protein YncE
MVQFLLSTAHRRSPRVFLSSILGLLLSIVLVAPVAQAGQKTTEARVPELLLEGGRKLTFERSITADRDVQRKQGFFTKVFDLVVGKPDLQFLVRPYGVVTDSKGRIIVSDPGAQGVHIFDLAQQKYKFIERRGKNQDAMRVPQCLAVDNQDNLYVTDSEAGKIFIFDSAGRYQRVLGSLKGGEGFFKRPTGIAVDSAAQQIYVTDTLRNRIFVLDMQGHVIKSFGQTGRGPGEFNYPTELHLDGKDLIVVDAMNFRVQVVNRSGEFQYGIGQIGDAIGAMFRPKGVSMDSEDHLYVVEGTTGMVQVFNRKGDLLYYFGQKGTGFGEFRLPAGLYIDRDDRVFVVDSYNARVQVFRYYGLKSSQGGVPSQGGVQ